LEELAAKLKRNVGVATLTEALELERPNEKNASGLPGAFFLRCGNLVRPGRVENICFFLLQTDHSRQQNAMEPAKVKGIRRVRRRWRYASGNFFSESFKGGCHEENRIAAFRFGFRNQYSNRCGFACQGAASALCP
jgi:hypothetical protein